MSQMPPAGPGPPPQPLPYGVPPQYPAYSSPPPTGPSWWGRKSGKTKALLIIGAVFGVLIILTGIGSAASPSTPTAVKTVTTEPAVNTPSPTAAPTATTDTAVGAYASIIASGLADFSAKGTVVGTKCTASDVATCRAGLVAVRDSAQQFLDALAKHPAPAQVSQGDGTLRQSLGDYISGADLGIKGLDGNDPSEIAAGGDQVRQGTTLLQTATKQLTSELGE